jgi:hypothetical protein
MPEKTTEHVEPVTNLQEFFRNSVASVAARQSLELDDHTEYYVVNLLTLYSRSEVLFDKTENGTELKPLARILAEAVDSADPAERNFALQRVGDLSLFLAGFFGDGLSRKLVDVDYYVQMGGAAYGTLSANVRGSARGRLLGAVFEELARNFIDLVDVLAEIREDSREVHDTDILRMYEVWLKTGSRRAARRLREAGIEPNRRFGADTWH